MLLQNDAAATRRKTCLALRRQDQVRCTVRVMLQVLVMLQGKCDLGQLDTEHFNESKTSQFLNGATVNSCRETFCKNP